MANTTSAVLQALKYTYGTNRLLYLFNQESVGFDILGHVKKPVGGRGQFILPIIKQNPGAFTGITEGGALPTALDMATTEATFKLQEYTAVYTITWKLIQDSRTDKFAFQQAVTMLDEGVRRRVMRNLNADLIDDGRGRLAKLSAAVSSASTFTSSYLPRLEVGMSVDIMQNADDDTEDSNANVVTGVDPQARTVTLTSTFTGSAGDYAVIRDTTDISLNANALHSNGLLGVISSSNPTSSTVVPNYGTINRSTAGNEFWKSIQLSNSGTNRPLTEDLLLQCLDYVVEKGGGKVTHIMSNRPILRRYHEMLAGERYFSLSQPGAIGGGIGRKSSKYDEAGGDGDGGKTPYEFSGVPWHCDPYFQSNTIIGLDASHFFIGVGDNEVPKPVSEVFDDVPYFKYTSNATFDINWYYQMQLLSDNPAAGFQLQDIAES